MILINLLPPDLRRKETTKIVLPDIPVKKTLIIAVAVLLALQSLMSLAALFYVTRYRFVRHESQALSEKMIDLRLVQSKTTSIGNKLKELNALTERKFYWASLLNELTMTATRGVWLRSLSLEEQTVQKPKKEEAAPAKGGAVKKSAMVAEKFYVLRMEGSCGGGSGQETALIGKYLKALKDSPYFQELFGKSIDLSNIQQRKIADVDVFDFVVQCRFKKEKI